MNDEVIKFLKWAHDNHYKYSIQADKEIMICDGEEVVTNSFCIQLLDAAGEKLFCKAASSNLEDAFEVLAGWVGSCTK